MNTSKSLKVLIIGQGGREHALVHALSRSSRIQEIHAIPGSAGIALQATCHQIEWRNHQAIIDFCKMNAMDFVFIGPEDPLVNGLSDQLRKQGILTVGPSQEGALLEGSKVYAKEFMNEAGIPTSPFRIVTTVEETLSASIFFTPPYVLKADGLAAGKGVYICSDQEELKKNARLIFEKKIHGKSGERALLEQFSPGYEISYIFLTNGEDFVPLPLARDHKRLLDGQKGPNTGGMGTVAPLTISSSLDDKIKEKIIKPTLKLLQSKEILYRGVLFLGLMVQGNGSNEEPSLLEYNCRLGDPETQAILPLIENDIGELFYSLAQGKVNTIKALENFHTCCLVMAAPGYPDQVRKGIPIEGELTTSQLESSYFLHAGTRMLKGTNKWVTEGGRVLNSIGIGKTQREAKMNAYENAKKVRWEGLQMRSDIGEESKTE